MQFRYHLHISFSNSFLFAVSMLKLQNASIRIITRNEYNAHTEMNTTLTQLRYWKR